MGTSVASLGGTSWAAVEMGGSAKTYNNFWELFARPSGTATWKLVTPPGMASNGGLATAVTGTQSAAMAFLASQDMKFSPLSSSADDGQSWSAVPPISSGLATSPDALAAGPHGKLLALNASGQVYSGTTLGASWAQLSSEKSVAATPAGRACGLTGLTATSWTPAGTAMLAGTCSKAGRVGIFAASGSSWHAAAPALSGSLASGPADVIALATTGTRTTAVIAAGTGSTPELITAWSGDGGSHWTLSPALRAGQQSALSISIWPDGSVGVVLSGGRGKTISWQSSGWQSLPPLPANTATLAQGPGTQLEALAAHGSTLTVWQLSATGKAWVMSQKTQVQIPYGSSD